MGCVLRGTLLNSSEHVSRYIHMGEHTLKPVDKVAFALRMRMTP